MGTAGLLGLLVASWALIAVNSGHDLATLIAGVALLDLAVQGAHVTNLGVIYRLRPEARSRITTVYMTSVFLGGMAGSSASGAALAAGGWSAVAIVGRRSRRSRWSSGSRTRSHSAAMTRLSPWANRAPDLC